MLYLPAQIMEPVNDECNKIEDIQYNNDPLELVLCKNHALKISDPNIHQEKWKENHDIDLRSTFDDVFDIRDTFFQALDTLPPEENHVIIMRNPMWLNNCTKRYERDLNGNCWRWITLRYITLWSRRTHYWSSNHSGYNRDWTICWGCRLDVSGCYS